MLLIDLPSIGHRAFRSVVHTSICEAEKTCYLRFNRRWYRSALFNAIGSPGEPGPVERSIGARLQRAAGTDCSLDISRAGLVTSQRSCEWASSMRNADVQGQLAGYQAAGSAASSRTVSLVTWPAALEPDEIPATSHRWDRRVLAKPPGPGSCGSSRPVVGTKTMSHGLLDGHGLHASRRDPRSFAYQTKGARVKR